MNMYLGILLSANLFQITSIHCLKFASNVQITLERYEYV